MILNYTSSLSGAAISRSLSGLRIPSAVGILAVSASIIACDSNGSSAKSTVTPAPAAADIPEVVATIGSEKITAADVRGRIGTQLDESEMRYQRARSRMIVSAIDEIVRDRLLEAEARKQNKSFEELVSAEGGARALPTEAEISAFFRRSQSRFRNRTLDDVRPQIIAILMRGRQNDVARRLSDSLAKERDVKINYQPFHVAFDNRGAPSLGNARAPVTLVEFSDFQCPFCATFAPTLKRVAQQFGDSVQIVYRQFPLMRIHPFAAKAAEASLCANEQGKFWELHDLMLAEQRSLGVPELKQKAARLKVDQEKFDTCLDSEKYAQRVQKDVEEGKRAGVTGTPAIFINGNQLAGGAVTYDAIAAAIRTEFSRAR